MCLLTNMTLNRYGDSDAIARGNMAQDSLLDTHPNEHINT